MTLNPSGDGSACRGLVIWGCGDGHSVDSLWWCLIQTFPSALSTVLPPLPLTVTKKGKPSEKELCFSLSIPKMAPLFLIFLPLSNFKGKSFFSEAVFFTCHLFLPLLISSGTLFHQVSLSLWHFEPIFLQQIFNSCSQTSLGLLRPERSRENCPPFCFSSSLFSPRVLEATSLPPFSCTTFPP